MNNLLVDVEIFSLCRKETLFQAEFQQYKWKSWSSFLTDKFDQTLFGGGGVVLEGFGRGFCPGVYIREVVPRVYVLEPFWQQN